MLIDDRLRSDQGMAPVSAFELHDYVVKAHRIISIDGALVTFGEGDSPGLLCRQVRSARCALGSRDCEAAIELGDVVIVQKQVFTKTLCAGSAHRAAAENQAIFRPEYVAG